ncbi:hypothetical protein swp_4343 [Shewanella piezotolerans WP3]|uniref:Lipoprotein n=1 Tax=Shewanella piezotolerans (strain WP3 / JCM 13877) TaxID=225849 RepID=B8CT81_SHEPW|nr:hypothetical protein [Shewanella piezotolerans]ACJ30990.1 hypothetical protein swp_4343 [Shewanella piezotolerans WP3]
MRLIPLCAALLLTAGCTADKATPDQNVQAKVTKVAEAEVETNAIGMDKVSTSNATSLQLNGAKFIAETTPLAKGTRVFNPEMSQGGILKGSFVVQSESGIDSLHTLYSIEQIAAETYRLIPTDEDVDLLVMYKSLQQDVSLRTVEIEIDYSRSLATDEY